MKKTGTKKSLILFTICAISLLTFNSNAQNATDAKTGHASYYVEPNIGITQYFGDLNPENHSNKEKGLGAGLILGCQLNPVLGLRAQFVTSNLKSKSDVWQQSLASKVWDLSLQLKVNVIEIFKTDPDRLINFYLIGGAGYIHESPSLTNYDGTPGESATHGGFLIPVGGNVSVTLTQKINLNFEYSQRLTTNDTGLDNKAFTQKHDQYSYASVGATYKF